MPLFNDDFSYSDDEKISIRADPSSEKSPFNTETDKCSAPPTIISPSKKKMGKLDWTQFVAFIKLKHSSIWTDEHLERIIDNDIKLLLESLVSGSDRSNTALLLSKCKDYLPLPEQPHERNLLIDFGNEFSRKEYLSKLYKGKILECRGKRKRQTLEILELRDLSVNEDDRRLFVLAINGSVVKPNSLNFGRIEPCNLINPKPNPQTDYVPSSPTQVLTDSNQSEEPIISNQVTNTEPIIPNEEVERLHHVLLGYEEKFNQLKRNRDEYERDLLDRVTRSVNERFGGTEDEVIYSGDDKISILL